MFFLTKSFVIDKLLDAAASATQVAALTGEIGRLKASLDWMAARVNALEVERALLLDKLLQVQIPVVEYAREDRPTPELSPETLRTMAARYAPAPGTVYTPTKDDPIPAATAEAQAAMSIFEDMGDEAAAKARATWGPNGELVYGQ